MINCHYWKGNNTFGFDGKEIEMEKDFDFIDLVEPKNKQAAPLSSNGNKGKN